MEAVCSEKDGARAQGRAAGANDGCRAEERHVKTENEPLPVVQKRKSWVAARKTRSRRDALDAFWRGPNNAPNTGPQTHK